MSDDRLLLALLFLPFAASLLAACLPTNARNAEAWLAGSVALLVLVLAIVLNPGGAEGGVVRSRIEWLPSLGIDFTLRLDGFAWLFTLLISAIGVLVVLYTRYYMRPDEPVPRFFSYLLGFMGAMLGIVLSGNLVQMVFFWELTGLYSFLLIAYRHQNPKARDGARMALIVTGAGGLCLLAGVLLIGHIVGSYELDEVLGSGDLIRRHELYLPTLLLVLLGTLTKSAQFPFHFWLPRAMAAPTPVSAYLHSATMVKAGVFLLARLWPVLSNTDEWFWIVGTCGLGTLLLGAYLAIFQHDLKGVLAYSTISHLGLITLLLGLDSPLAAVAAIFHMMNHATFKASLFMAAGIIDHEAGTRDIRRLSGIYRFMPITATLAMVAAAAMAGVPLLNGFLSKEMFFAETIESHVDSALDDALPYVATLASLFAVAYSLRVIHGVFFGPPPTDLPRTPHEPPRWMLAPVALLVLACLVVGILPGVTVGPLLDIAVRSVLGASTPEYSLRVWHGFTWPLLMSFAALAGGVGFYLLLQPFLRRGLDSPPLLSYLKGKRFFDHFVVLLSWRWARVGADLLSTRRLQPQLRLLVCAAMLAALVPLLGQQLLSEQRQDALADPAFALLWLIGIACALGSAILAKYHRFAALVLMGGAGLVTCITFAWFSAPDLALTQLLVEVVTTALLLLGLRWLPARLDRDGRPSLGARWRRARDLTIAVAAGGGLAAIAYATMTRPQPDSIAGFFLEKAYSGGGGTNVVNVILVDFRGFDTLGEITVLGIVALTVYALLRRFRPAPDSLGSPLQQNLQDASDDAHPERQRGDGLADSMLVPAVIMRALFPVIAAVAVYLFLRGHDLPGGGFVAGLTLSVAFILQYMAMGTRWVEARLTVQPVRWMGFGLLFAVLTGAGAWLFGYPFLTSHHSYAELPLVGEVPLASAVIFDLGVFTLVVGATVLILIALAHQSIRVHRPRPLDVPDGSA